MKNLKSALLVIIAAMCVALPASAQFRIGIKAGLDVNSVSVDNISSNFSAENRTGFTAGITSEFTVPVVGIGFDLSVMYVHRNTEANIKDDALEEILTDPNFRKEDFIEIPLNIKWKIGLPVVGKIVTPYITTGPSVAFKCSKEAVTAAYKEKKFNATWNLGGGLQLFGHLQVGAYYGWGMTKMIEKQIGNESVDIKNNGWKITAAYFF